MSHLDQNYEQAVQLYSEAIELNPNIAAYYGNRSFAHLKMESFGYALSDATKALELDKTYIKVSSFSINFLYLQYCLKCRLIFKCNIVL